MNNFFFGFWITRAHALRWLDFRLSDADLLLRKGENDPREIYWIGSIKNRRDFIKFTKFVFENKTMTILGRTTTSHWMLDILKKRRVKFVTAQIGEELRYMVTWEDMNYVSKTKESTPEVSSVSQETEANQEV